jgi:hypothetical protein
MGRRRGEGWRLIRVVAPLGAFVVEGWAALVVAVIVQEGGLWLARRLVEPCQATFGRRLFLAAYGLRMAVALPTHYVAKLGNGNGALFPDDYTNDLVGEWLLRIAQGDGTTSIFPGHQHLLVSVYPYLLMATYGVFGYTPLLPKLLNIGLASLSVVLIFDMASRAFSMRAAVLAAAGAAVLPTILIWSVVSLKESIVLFAAVLALRVVQFLSTAPAHSSRIVDGLVLLLALAALLIDLRPATAVTLVGLMLIVWVARSQYRPRLASWRFGFAALAIVVLVGGGLWFARSRSSDRPITAVVEDVVLQIRHRRAQEAATARSQLRPEQDVFTATGSQLPEAEAASDAAPFNIIGDVFDPLGYALLAPAPWQTQTLTELAVSGEMLVWYVLLAAGFFAWRGEPRQHLFMVCLVAYAIANWLVLAASEGNLGNLLRHRLMLDPSLLLLGCGGLEWLIRRQAFARR